MLSIPSSELPIRIKSWLERQLQQNLGPKQVISVSAFVSGRNSKFSKHYEMMKSRTERRLKTVARKMRKAGLSEADIQCMLRGGLREGESYFNTPKISKKSKKIKVR